MRIAEFKYEGKSMKIFPKSFRLSISVFLILNLNFILFISSVFAQYFTIDKFHVDITLLEEGVFRGVAVAAETGKGFFYYFA